MRTGLEQLSGLDLLHVRGARDVAARLEHVLHAAVSHPVALVLALNDADAQQLADRFTVVDPVALAVPDADDDGEPLGLALAHSLALG